jgi:hypothetical protein
LLFVIIIQNEGAANSIIDNVKNKISMRGHLVNIINILFNERSRVALIMRLAPVETPKLAQTHNKESLDNALLLLG